MTRKFENLVIIACKPGGGGHGVPVANISEWKFKLLVYFIKQSDMTSFPIEMNRIHTIQLCEIEDHRNLKLTHNNSIMTASVSTQSLIDKDIDVVWDLIHEHLESIRGIHGVPIFWCTHSKVFPKDHLLDSSQEYLSTDEDMINHCPMIMATYVRPRNEILDEIIGVRLSTHMFKEDNKIVFRHFLQIFGTNSLWAHTKCAVKTRYRRLVYKIIFSHFFGKNVLDNFDAAYDTAIARIE